MPTPRGETLLELARRRARDSPERPAFVFLGRGLEEGPRLTYAQLDERARAVAAALEASDLAGERVVLLHPPGLEFVTAFYGCIYAGAIPVPVAPPDPRRLKRTLPRVEGIIGDCQPRAVLTTAKLKALAMLLLPGRPALRKLEWLSSAKLERGSAAAWTEPEVSADTTAFLQYTSGSTGSPRGVVISHSNLLVNQEMIRIVSDSTEASIILSWVPFYHDLGLIGGIVHPVYVGAKSLLMSPFEFVKSPVSWLRAITLHRATMSAGPTFAFEICARKASEQDCEGLDLSSWRMALIGAEPISAKTLERFEGKFAPHGFRKTSFFQGYGLAEAVLSVSSGTLGETHRTLRVEKQALRDNRVALAGAGSDDSVELVSCGQPLPDQTVLVIDSDSGEPLGELEIGEVWVAGGNVAGGYWNRPEESRRTFEARVASTGEGPFLRTGDLGFVSEGELFVTGRLKDLIIIRGRNYYPQDVEAAVEGAHPALRPGCGAAFPIELEGGESLVVLQEVRPRKMKGLDPRDVIAAIRRTLLLDQELRPHAVVLLEAQTIPKTTSGKIRRAECKRLYLAEDLSPVAGGVDRQEEGTTPLVSLEELTAHEGEARLGVLLASLRTSLIRSLGLAEDELDPRTPLAETGLDSLAILSLSHQVETRLGVELDFEILLEGASLETVASFILDRIERDAVDA